MQYRTAPTAADISSDAIHKITHLLIEETQGMNSQNPDRMLNMGIAYFKWSLGCTVIMMSLRYLLRDYLQGIPIFFFLLCNLFLGWMLGMVKALEAGIRFDKSRPPEDIDLQEGTALGAVRAKLKDRSNSKSQPGA